MRSAGKLNSPLALLTTVVVTVDPSFLALTRTPSIRPSSVEETLPLSATAVCACAPTVKRPASRPARLTVVRSVLDCIFLSLSRLPALDSVGPVLPRWLCGLGSLKLDGPQAGATISAYWAATAADLCQRELTAIVQNFTVYARFLPYFLEAGKGRKCRNGRTRSAAELSKVSDVSLGVAPWRNFRPAPRAVRKKSPAALLRGRSQLVDCSPVGLPLTRVPLFRRYAGVSASRRR